ncbi:unnamed protein product [Vitrella brassicaformis CCMP3155]|uniref:ATPTG10-like domain-containing protein n=1 Tax=Vitrella brassicaformis (strain CCMP3155) TaxID=1169540 RepID=A0A0G4ENC0_VITBC|nr:unnamed protein product [Vitrella brassicaformis CCMP3155]|eukprot:CEL98677.1 unnamed protein product [Vitrella brassicaformis CCMP3155]
MSGASSSPLTADQQTFVTAELAKQKPAAVERLISDLKMIVAYETAADWQEEQAMKMAFNAFSWDDVNVVKALPEYLKSTGSQRARVDYAFNVLMPRPAHTTDVKQSMMALWLKARLFSYDKHFPFQFNPYAR